MKIASSIRKKVVNMIFQTEKDFLNKLLIDTVLVCHILIFNNLYMLLKVSKTDHLLE